MAALWDRPLSRRTVLKAGGVALALPYLEAMRPGRASAAACLDEPKMVTICATLGLYTPSWLPETTGPDYQATEYLSIIDHHRPRYTILSGLSHEEQVGRQPHNSEITWLTGARHPGTDGFKNTISVDQVVAKDLGYVTRYPSIALGTNTPQSQSYTSTGVMVPAEASPASLFAKLFLEGTPEEVEREKARLRGGASILDHLLDKRNSLRHRLGSDDNRALDAYFGAVREAEVQLAEINVWSDRPKPVVDAEVPVDETNNAMLIRRIRLMFGMIPLILETDSTRVITMMLQDHSVVPADVPGAGSDQHGLSHHGQEPVKIRQLQLVEVAIMEAFRDLLDDMHARSGGSGSLLDETALVFGSNLGNASSHDTRHTPLLVAGGGFPHGEHIAFGEDGLDAPLSNFHVTLLQRMGIEGEGFGQSTGPLSWGSGLRACAGGDQEERGGPTRLPGLGEFGGRRYPRRGGLGRS